MPLNLECSFCGKQFVYDRPAGKTGRNPRCCSENCYKAKQLRRWREQEAARSAALIAVSCKSCGMAIPARGNRRCDPCRAVSARAVRVRENAKRSKQRQSVILTRAADRRHQRAEQLSERRKQRERARESKPWLAAGLSDSERYAVRYRNDPQFRAHERERTRRRERTKTKPIEKGLRYVLTRTNANSLSLEALGYTADDLRAHFEERFDPSMTWQAFKAGRIHISHVVPLAGFDLDSEEDVLAAWAISNLRPLWAEDNLKHNTSAGMRRTRGA